MEEKKFTGTGTCMFGKCKYSGDLANGLQHGKGKMEFENYDLYDGDWVEGKMEGYGTYRFYDKRKDGYSKKQYEGHFRNNVREGIGRMTYENGDVYVGQWQNDCRTGEGVCYFHNGDIFQGIWKFDKMVRGLYRKANGEIYDGEIKEGEYDGYGKYIWPTGKWFEGIFVKSLPHKGKLYTTEGTISEFKDGKPA